MIMVDGFSRTTARRLADFQVTSHWSVLCDCLGEVPFEAEMELTYAASAFNSSPLRDIGGIPPCCIRAVGCFSRVVRAAGAKFLPVPASAGAAAVPATPSIP